MNLIQQLEEYRLKHRLSQAKVAKKLGVSFATVNRWFNKRTVPNKIQQYHIVQLLKNTEK